MNTRKRRAGGAGTMAVLLFLPLVLAACGREDGNAAKEKKPPLVEVETVQSGPITRQLDLSAEVVPVNAVQLSSMVDGPIDFFPWREGDTVKAGEKIVVIDRDTYLAEVETARAALKVAKARLDDLQAGTRPEEIDKARQSVQEAQRNAEFDQTDLARIKKLVEIGALPGEELDKAHVRWTAAQAKHESARRHLDMLRTGPTPTETAVQESLVEEAAAKLALAEARFDESVIAAPFAGTITRTYVRPGDMALARTPLLEMADMDSLVLRFAVPENHVMKVEVGMPLTFELDALPGKTFSTEVSRVYPELDPQMRTRTVEATLPALKGAASRMFARIELMLERAETATLVPAEALLTDPSGKHFLFVAKDGAAQRRPIETGIEQETVVQVVAGVQPGEAVVVSGHSGLKDGQTIRLPGAASSDGGKSEGGKQGTTPGSSGRSQGSPGKGSGQGKRGGGQQGNAVNEGPGRGTRQ